MRHLFEFLCVCALGLMPLVGCSETAGTGGSGAGVPCETVEDCPEADLCTDEIDCINRLCFNTPLDCDDYSDCTVNTCDPAVGCEETTVADGTPCAGGMCQAGQCALSGTVLPCTEQGIHNAVAVGGGPYTFDCDGPTTAATDASFDVAAEVILDGEGNLSVDGGHFGVSPPEFGAVASLELRGFSLLKGPGTISISGDAVLTFVDSTLGHRASIRSLGQGATVVVVNSTLWGAISNEDGATLIMTNSTLSGGSIYHGGTAATIINSTLSGGGCVIDAISRPYTIANSVVEGLCCADVTSNGYNIESPGDTCGFDQPTDQVNVSADDLKLGGLDDNGGPTETRAPAEGSVAIDQIPAEDCVDADGEPLTTDQRGVTRPQSDACDVGAVEMEVTP